MRPFLEAKELTWLMKRPEFSFLKVCVIKDAAANIYFLLQMNRFLKSTFVHDGCDITWPYLKLKGVN